MELTKRVILVTGATGGLGRRICRALAAEGAAIGVACHSDRSGAESLAGELRALGAEEAIPLAGDITDAAAVDALLSELKEGLGPPEALVLNAAANQWVAFDDLESLTPAVWRRLIEENLTGNYLLARAAAPSLKAASGAIVAVASEAAFTPAGSSIAYSVAKAGLVHLVKCLAVALAPEVRVNAVAPGFMEDTKMSSKIDPGKIEGIIESRLLRRSADKDDVAAAIRMLLTNGSITGQTLVVDSGKVFH